MILHRRLLKYIPLLLFAMVVLLMHFSTGKLAALQSGTTEVVSGCNDPSSLNCKTNTINPDSYFELWDSAGSSGKTVQLSITVTCVTGDESFMLSAGNGATAVQANKDLQTICAGTGAAAAAGNAATETATGSFTFTNPCTSNKDYVTQFCTADIEIIAKDPPANDTYSGGHVEVNISTNDGTTDVSAAPQIKNEGDPDPGNAWDPTGGANQFSFFAGGNNPTFNFRTPCTYGNTPVYIAWSGADYGAPYTSANIGWTLTDDTTKTPVYSITNPVQGSGIQSNAGTLGAYLSNKVLDFKFTPKAGDEYTWQWLNQSGQNQVVYSIPFATNAPDEGASCPIPNQPWSLSGMSYIDGDPGATNEVVSPQDPGGAATGKLYHEVTNNGPGDATYNWRVMSSNSPNTSPQNFDPTNITGAVPAPGNTAGPGDIAAQLASSNPHIFPAGTANGTKYCQLIRYTPKSSTGGTPDYGYSSPVCLTYSSSPSSIPNPPAPGTITGTCSFAEYNVGSGADLTDDSGKQSTTWTGDGATGVRYAVYETANGVPATGWVAGQTLTSSSAYPAIGTYNGVSSIKSQTDSPVSPNTNLNYVLTPAQLRTGTVVWYMVTYNVAKDTWTTGSTNHTLYETHISSVSSSSAANCYQASCTLNIAPGPLGGTNMEGGKGFTVTGTVNNIGSNTLSDPLPGSNYPIAVVITMDGGTPNIVQLADPGDIPPGGSATSTTVNFTAPVDTATHTITCTPIYQGWPGSTYGIIGGPSSGTIYDYEPFNITGNANTQFTCSIDCSDPAEDPSGVNKTFTVNNTTPWPASSTNYDDLYYNPPGATPLSGSDSLVEGDTNSGSYGQATYTYRYAVPPSQQNAGYGWCAAITIAPATGWVGPGGAELPTGNYTSSPSCVTVHNDPFFKVNGSGIKAGGDFLRPGVTTTCAGGGTLAGWDSDVDYFPPQWNYGSTSQSETLALDNILGVASGIKNNNSRTPYEVSFANDTNVTPRDGDSPNLGGNYGSIQCLVDESASTSAPPVAYPSATGSALPTPGAGSYSYKTGSDLDINGGAITNGENVSIFVSGNVQIDNNITYTDANAGNWSVSSTPPSTDVPSFTIVAKGNIYIAPGVTTLDGTYISDGASGGSQTAGNIYTCGSSYTPDTASQYDTCKNQLVVHGQFEADNVHLMRTLGSLRNEQPNAPTPAVTDPTTETIPLQRDYCGGGTGYPGIHFYEAGGTPSTPRGCSADAVPTAGNVLPASKPQQGGTVALYYFYRQNIGDNYYDTDLTLAAADSEAEFLDSPAPVLVGYVVPTEGGSCPSSFGSSGAPLEGLHKYYDGNYDFYTTNPAEQGPLTDGGIVACVFDSSGQAGTQTTPQAVSAPNLVPGSCSNSAGAAWVDTSTCAAEVFDFSPELYLGQPPVLTNAEEGNDDDAIVSLPPVF
jgi:hypothetical protein